MAQGLALDFTLPLDPFFLPPSPLLPFLSPIFLIQKCRFALELGRARRLQAWCVKGPYFFPSAPCSIARANPVANPVMLSRYPIARVSLSSLATDAHLFS